MVPTSTQLGGCVAEGVCGGYGFRKERNAKVIGSEHSRGRQKDGE